MDEKVFISYSREDKDRVFSLKKEIEEHIGSGSCWLDITGIESDKEFVDVIIDAINRTEFFLFFYSSASKDSYWTKKELQYAERKHKRIIFVRIDNTPLTEWFEFKYGEHDIIDIRIKEQKQKLIDNLVNWCCPNFDLTEEETVPSTPQKDVHQDTGPIRISVWVACVIVGILLFGGVWMMLNRSDSKQVVIETAPSKEQKETPPSNLEQNESPLDKAQGELHSRLEHIRHRLDDAYYIYKLEGITKNLKADIEGFNRSLEQYRAQLGNDEYLKWKRELESLLLGFFDEKWNKFEESYNKGLITRTVAEDRSRMMLSFLNCIREGIEYSAYSTRRSKIQSIFSQ